MQIEKKQVLITVKTYPNPSKKYSETVCCAGIDIDTGQWIRLYPVPFRDLDRSKKFKKYNIIEVGCWKSAGDPRIESYKVDCDSILIVRQIDTGKGRQWKERKTIVLPTVSSSFCSILCDAGHNKSLGMFKARDIVFSWRKSSPKDQAKKKAHYAQLSFLDRQKEPIEDIPFDFHYGFKCNGSPDCPGHTLPIRDWELFQSYRDWRQQYDTQSLLLDKIKERWQTRMCAQKNDVYFYVGNILHLPYQFMVLGVFYPPKNTVENS